jgi:ribosome-binding factor A
MPSQRVHRVQNLLRAEISTVLLRKLKDPRVHMVTVSEVDVAPDLKNAHVWVSVYGEREYREEALEGLRSAAGYIRKELMNVLNLRPMPFLTFDLDTSLERGAHTLDVLDEALHEHKDQPGDEPGGVADTEQ